MAFTRVMAIHVDHTAARKNSSLTREALARICTLCTVYQVDVMGGDFNASVYRYFAASKSQQRCCSVADASLASVLMGMRETINKELTKDGSEYEDTWLGGPFEYQLIVANTPYSMTQYNTAIEKQLEQMKRMKEAGEIITAETRTRLLQESIEDFGCDTMAVILFSWAHSNERVHAFTPSKPQHRKAHRPGMEYNIHVLGYHLELTSTVLGLRPKDRDFHTILNIIATDWSGLYKKQFQTESERAFQAQLTNSEWRQLRLQQEEKQGFRRRKHGVPDYSYMEEQYNAQERPAKSAGRGTDYQSRQWSSASSDGRGANWWSSWSWSSHW